MKQRPTSLLLLGIFAMQEGASKAQHTTSSVEVMLTHYRDGTWTAARGSRGRGGGGATEGFGANDTIDTSLAVGRDFMFRAGGFL